MISQTRSIDLEYLDGRHDPEDGALETDDAASLAPAQWDDAKESICGSIVAQCDALWRIDQRIQYLNRLLDAAQPFGSRKVNIRWYDNGRGRRDPTPVRFVRSLHPHPLAQRMAGNGWRVIRLDRGIHKNTPLRQHIRKSGPFADFKARAPAVAVARQIESALIERRLIITSLGVSKHRAAAAFRLLKRSEAFLARGT